MTYFIYALENTTARLCASRTRTDNQAVRDLVVAHYESLGYIVKVDVEA